MSGILNVVKGCPLFHELYDQEVMKIVEKCQVLSLEAGDTIFKEGDEGSQIYIILNGAAKVVKKGVELARLRKGDLFGELVLLNENTRTADIVSDGYTDLLVMNYEDIFGLYKSEPKIFSLLILNLSRLLSRRLKDASTTIRNLNDRVEVLESQKKAS